MVARNRERGFPALTGLAIALAMYGALADEAPQDGAGSYDIDEIIVTASRRAESALQSPFAVSVRGMQELQAERQVRTIPDAMRDLPGVMVQKTAHGQGSPFIRGFTGLRTLFLLDGIRLNNSTFREGPNQYWNTVDPLGAYRLELVKGPTSVLYGSDAIGGTVNAISRSYYDMPWAGGLNGRVYSRAASAENSLVFRPELAYAGERFDVMAAVSWKDFGDLEGGADLGTQPKTGYEERNADLKLHVSLAENQEVVAAFQYVDQDDAWRVHKTIFGKSWKGTTVGNELRRSLFQERTLSYLQFRAKDLGRNFEEVIVSASYHEQNEERIRTRADGRTDLQSVEVGTAGLFAHAVMPSPVGDITAGLEFYDDNVDSARSDYNADGTLRAIRIQGPVADDAIYTTAAAFLQDQVTLGERTRVVLGLRYTKAKVDARRVQDPLTGDVVRIRDDWNATTLSVRFSHELAVANQASLFGGISQGFRAPNLSDLTRFDTARSNEIETPVENLDAENFLTYEVGLKYLSDRWSNQFAVYFTDIDDMVIRTPTGVVIDGDNEITKRNSGDGFVRGVELQSRYRIGEDWSVYGNLTWMDGEVGTYPTSAPVLVDEPLDRLMPLTANLGLRWAPESSAGWIEGQLSHAAKQDTLSTRDAADTDRIPPGGTPGYTVATLRGGWQFSPDLSISAAVENLSDADYRIHGSGVNEPGRNFVVTLVWASR